MLKKLIKYEILADWKKYCIVGSAMIILSFMLLIADRILNLIGSSRIIQYIFIMLAFIFGVLITTSAVMLVVFSTTRFYKSFVRDEGYLTHTLPVPTWQLLVSKLIAVYIWFIFIVAITMICGGIAGGEPLWLFAAAESRDEMFMELSKQFGDGAALELIKMIKLTIILMIFTPALYMAHIYISFALGNLFSRNKLAMSVLMFFVISFAEQILYSIVSFPIVIKMMSELGENYEIAEGAADERLFELSSDSVLLAMVFSIIVAIGYFIAAERIFSKKLNLE